MRFWEWLRSVANNRVRERYMDRHGHDRRCPRCDTWTSEVNGALEVRDEGNGFEVMLCKRCRTWSRWDYRPGLIVVLADPWEVATLPHATNE